MGRRSYEDQVRWCGFSHTNVSRRVAGGGGGLTCWWCGFSNINERKAQWVANLLSDDAGLACWWCAFSNTNASRWVAGGDGLACWWCRFSNTNASLWLRCVCVVTYAPSYLCPIIPMPYHSNQHLEWVWVDNCAQFSNGCI